MIILGTIILLISWFGCCGAIRESYCMSMTVEYLLFLRLLTLTYLVILFISVLDSAVRPNDWPTGLGYLHVGAEGQVLANHGRCGGEGLGPSHPSFRLHGRPSDQRKFP